jgi:hypothetical protein
MFDQLKKLFKKETPATPAPKTKRKTKPKSEPQLSEKELATQRGEPYVAILKVDIDANNINAGAFELDWNQKFVANLARAGYQKKPGETEDTIVDRWFKEVCRNVVLEVYEQEMADPQNREMSALREELRNIQTRDIGNGRSEVQ